MCSGAWSNPAAPIPCLAPKAGCVAAAEGISNGLQKSSALIRGGGAAQEAVSGNCGIYEESCDSDVKSGSECCVIDGCG